MVCCSDNNLGRIEGQVMIYIIYSCWFFDYKVYLLLLKIGALMEDWNLAFRRLWQFLGVAYINDRFF